MKKILNILMALALMLGVASCSKEAPFSSGEEQGTGRFLSASLSVDLKSDERVVRSAVVPQVADLTVDFYLNGDFSANPVASYLYADMPEVVMLPAGKYRVKVSYGEDVEAGYDSPYYEGVSDEFTIVKDQLLDAAVNVVCAFANVKVTVLFDESLVRKMGNDSKVNVFIKEGKALDFKVETDKSGFFRYDAPDASNLPTLVATFSGTVDGNLVEERKIYNNVKAGNHYKITFKLVSIDANEPGNVGVGENGEGVVVSATVQLEDYTGNTTSVENPDDEEPMIDDTDRPKEDPLEPEEPVEPVVPDDPQNPAPTIVGAPASEEGKVGVDIDKVNEVADNLECVLLIHSEKGIKTFEVDIQSSTLTPDELGGVGLSDHLDLVNPGNLGEALSGLGFPINVGGMNDVTFKITGFLPMLGALGPGTHNFVLTVSDDNGTTVKTLKLQTK